MIRFIKSILSVLLVFPIFGADLDLKEKKCREEFEKLWEGFMREKREFPPWSAEWSEDELKKRYDQMVKDRWAFYFINKEDYAIPNAIGKFNDRFPISHDWTSWHSRYPYPLTFLYNQAVFHYNASFLSLHGHRILAIESPSAQNIQAFYALFTEYPVSPFVHLFSENEDNYPYWQEEVFLEKSGGYIPYHHWVQRHEIEPKQLFELVQEIRRQECAGAILGVSCRAGTGRTGTLIAAYLLLLDIDRQLETKEIKDLHIEIDKLVWELCLQRPFMVPHFFQYKLLYQLVDYYLSILR